MAKRETPLTGPKERDRMIFESAPIGIGRIAVDGCWLDTNKRLCGLLGYDQEELIGRPFFDVTHPEDSETSLTLFRQLVSGEFPSFFLEKRCVRKDEAVIWVRVNASLVCGGADGPDHVISVYEDISERVRQDTVQKRAHRSLRVLSKCNAALVRATDEAQLIEKVCGILSDESDYGKAVVEFPPDGDLEEMVAGGDGNMLPPNPSVLAMRTGEACVEKDILLVGEGGDPWRKEVARDGYRAMVALPLFCETGVLGSLNIFSHAPDAFDIVEIRLLLELANDLAYGINALRVAAKQKEGENRLRVLSHAVEQNPVAILITDIDGNIEYVNPRFSDLTGYGAEEVIGRNPRLLKSGEKSAEAYGHLWATITSGNDWHGELHNRHKDGSLFWAKVAISPIRNPDGAIRHFIGIEEDVTESKRAASALQESEAQIKAVIDNSPTLIFVKDIEGRYLLVNKEFERQHGVTAEKVRGTTPYDFFPKDVADMMSSRDGEVLAKGTPVEYEDTVPSADGAPRVRQVTKFPIFDADGQVVSMGGIILDVTERKLTDERLRQGEKMDALGNLAGGIAHDLKNMLFPVLSLTRMVMKDFPEGDRARKRMEMILQAAERAHELVKKIHAFSHKEEMNRQEVDVADMVRGAVDLLRPMLPSSIGLKTEFPAEGDCSVMADVTQIQSVLMNLSSNAADAMEGKTGTLTVSVSRLDAAPEAVVGKMGLSSGPCARIVVSDTGEGMDAETLGRIFDPYFTTKEKGKGTGLGLAMVGKIIGEHGGAVTASSVPGEGSAFEIVLPLTEPGAGLVDQENSRSEDDA